MGRIIKEYRYYQQEQLSFDQDNTPQLTKYQLQLIEESKATLQMVEGKVIDFYQQLNSYISENKEVIE